MRQQGKARFLPKRREVEVLGFFKCEKCSSETPHVARITRAGFIFRCTACLQEVGLGRFARCPKCQTFVAVIGLSIIPRSARIVCSDYKGGFVESRASLLVWNGGIISHLCAPIIGGGEVAKK